MRGRFLGRPNRFIAEAEIDGEILFAHVPNTGRMSELLVPGCAAWFMPAGNTGRKTRFDLVLVAHEGGWVAVDSREANRAMGALFDRAARGEMAARKQIERFFGARFSGISSVRREVPIEDHRVDFLLESAAVRTWAEVKSVNLVRKGLALFPDAPTGRGRSHLDLLCRLAERGEGAAVVFVVQRDDAEAFAPNRAEDPAFAEALARAKAAAVGTHAVVAAVSPAGTRLLRSIPVMFPKAGSSR